jgi:pentatricopeptide repeat protein
MLSTLQILTYFSTRIIVNVCCLDEMLYIRKLSHQIFASSSSVLSLLLAASSSNVTQVLRCRPQAYWSFSSVRHFGSSSLTRLDTQTVVLGLQNKSALQLKSLSMIAGTILVQARDPAKLSMEIQNAIDEGRFSDTWKLYEQHMQMAGFPRKSVVHNLITSFAESLDVQWLEKAYGLVEKAFEEGKQTLFEKEPLIYLSFCLAKSGLPVLASTILRKLVEMEEYPPVTAWSAILAHMSQTAPGAYLAAELILEIGYLFQDGRVDPRKKSNAPLISMKPNTTAVNIALAGCLLFGTTRKAEQLLDMIPRVGVKANANLLITMAHIYEKNGRREELRKLQRYIDETHNLSDIQFRQFYNCLLKCHLKFGDLDSASNMVLEMLRKAKEARNSLAAATLVYDAAASGKKSPPTLTPRQSLSQIQSEFSDNNKFIRYEECSRDRHYLKLEAEAKQVLGTLLAKLQMQVELITTEHGVLQPTERIYVKLVKAFLEAGKTKELAEFLIKVEKEDSPVSNDNSVLAHVINSCISLGWLDEAHDLLDEMRLAGVRTGSSVYSSLLKAYCRENRAGEVASLLRDARKAGIQLDSSCYEALMQSRVLHKDTQGALHLFREMKEANIPRAGHQEFEMLVKGCEEGSEAGLMTKLLQEIKEGQRVDSGVHDWNNVIHFFSKKRLMQDAEKALDKMRSLGHAPNAQTFHSMVTGYAAIGGKYVEVTELWGEMKSFASSTSMKFDQELLDSVLYTFVRGGFFVRANEVVEMMEKGNMFVDKYKYRTLFLKYHKTLHKGKAPKFQTEAQQKKRESALAFKKWVGLC